MEINKSCFQYLYSQKQLHLWNAWHIFLSFKFTDALLSSCHAQLLLWWGCNLIISLLFKTIHSYSQMPTVLNSFVIHKMIIRWLLEPSFLRTLGIYKIYSYESVCWTILRIIMHLFWPIDLLIPTGNLNIYFKEYMLTTTNSIDFNYIQFVTIA